MKKLKLNKKTSIFFIGIGGISQSALAKLMVNLKCTVSGSDIKPTKITKELENLGVKVYYNQSIVNLKGNEDLLVYSGAISNSCPDLLFAKNNNILCLSRAEFLGIISKKYKNLIAISGTHGKTTTTAIIGEIFMCANKKPTIHIGGEVENLKSNILIGKNKFFITEACEYKKSFLQLKPNVSVITNIEKDHLDCYGSFENLKNAFREFSNSSDMCFCEYKTKSILKNKHITTVALKNKNADYCANNIKRINNCTYFDVIKNGEFYFRFKLNGKEEYNIKNALFAIAVADYFNIKKGIIYNALLNFKGVKRRNEFLGLINKTNFYADYAHHPTEIKNFLKSKNNLNDSLVIFQPHTYSRTILLFKDFVNVFNKCDNIIIYKTYSAREKVIIGGTETDLFEKLSSKNKVLCLTNIELKNYIIQNYSKYKNVYVIGAGNIYEIVNDIIKI